MKINIRVLVLFICAVALAGFQLWGTQAQAQSNYFSSMGCVNCHVPPVVATCNGCHSHGTHPTSAKSSINVAGKTNKASYAPGETVTVTMTGGYRTGWFRATLFAADGVTELARSNGNASGMGNSATYPATLTAPAPTTPGTYTWVIAWYGNKYDASGAAFGANWTPDPNNTNTGTANAEHGWEKVNLPSFTVAAAPVKTPKVSSVTPASLVQGAVNKTVKIVGTNLTGATVTFSNPGVTPGAATITATSISLPVSVTATATTGAGTITVTTATGSASKPFSVKKGPDTTKPTLSISALSDGAYSNADTLNICGSASDAGGLKSVTVNFNGKTVAVKPAASFTTARTLVTGANTVNVIAIDKAGNQQSDSRTINYDPATTLFTVSAPSDNSSTVQPFIDLAGTINDATTTVTVTNNNGTPQNASINGTGFSATVNLEPGVNTIVISATDLSSNTSSAKRTVIYDSSALTLAVTDPNQDITTTQPSLVLTGAVADASGKVTLQSTKNGVAFASPAATNGAFSKKLVFAKPGKYAITVTAKDASGHKSSVTRNIIYQP